MLTKFLINLLHSCWTYLNLCVVSFVISFSLFPNFNETRYEISVFDTTEDDQKHSKYIEPYIRQFKYLPFSYRHKIYSYIKGQIPNGRVAYFSIFLCRATDKVSFRQKSQSDCESLTDKMEKLGPILCGDPLFPARKLYHLQFNSVREASFLTARL